jgi:hypothetical protein
MYQIQLYTFEGKWLTIAPTEVHRITNCIKQEDLSSIEWLTKEEAECARKCLIRLDETVSFQIIENINSSPQIISHWSPSIK